MTDLKQHYGKPLAIMILMSGLFVIWVMIIGPYKNMLAEQSQDVQRAQQKLQRLQMLIENKDTFTAQYKSMQNNRSLDQVFLSRGKGVVAEARLQGIVRRLIERNGSVMTQSSLKKNDKPTVKGITLQVAMRGSVDSAYKIFHAMENGWPAMVVNNVTVQAVRAHYGRKSQQHAMTASYEVTAYVK